MSYKLQVESYKKLRAKRSLFLLFAISLLAISFHSCRDDEEIFRAEEETVSEGEDIDIKGFYLLNEGNMGSNKSTLDKYDFSTGVYSRNIYAEVNPDAVKELGDVGNDIKIYGSKLYAVINCSNKIEVMDAETCRKIGKIDVPNCRYINFHGGYAYVTSYAGPVQINPNYEQVGYVAKIDTLTMQVIDRCLVGFQPDELEIVGDKMYVANSGGYMVPNYENTVSVIDLNSFTETKRIEVAINLHRVRADKHGNLWVSSRGDYYGTASQLFWINTRTDQVEGQLDIAVSNLSLNGDSLYICSTEWSYLSMSNEVTYGIVNVADKQIGRASCRERV